MPQNHVKSPPSPDSWPKPSILGAVEGKIRFVNNTSDPQALRKHEHFCQVRSTTELTSSNSEDIPVLKQITTSSSFHSETVKVDPDNMLTDETVQSFKT